MAKGCFVCGSSIGKADRWVLVRGQRRESHCSEACLGDSLRKRRTVAAIRRRRFLRAGAASALVLTALGLAWRHRVPPSQTISLAWPEMRLESPPPAPEPIVFGPAWPPTDADWTAAFEQASWMYPLPGPARRAPVVDGRIFAEPQKGPSAVCRQEGRCGVDLGGELWGEHVYAALDGVVDRVRLDGGEDRGGQYVRISHFGGNAFTQYFHLAGMPRNIRRGAHIRAGDVIGLLGDTGLPNGQRHLHFTLSVRPAADFPEVYWDPTPFMQDWPLRVPPNGTVAGLAPVPLAASDRNEANNRRNRGRRASR